MTNSEIHKVTHIDNQVLVLDWEYPDALRDVVPHVADQNDFIITDSGDLVVSLERNTRIGSVVRGFQRARS